MQGNADIVNAICDSCQEKSMQLMQVSNEVHGAKHWHTCTNGTGDRTAKKTEFLMGEYTVPSILDHSVVPVKGNFRSASALRAITRHLLC